MTDVPALLFAMTEVDAESSADLCVSHRSVTANSGKDRRFQIRDRALRCGIRSFRGAKEITDLLFGCALEHNRGRAQVEALQRLAMLLL